jgi:DNA-binding NarL/FixJ family response regulator
MADGMSISGAPTSDATVFDQSVSFAASPLCIECGMRKEPMTADDLKAFPAQFNPKERRIIVLLCSGLTNKEIAVRIETSEQVVKNALRNVFQEVGCDDRANLLIRMMKFKYEGV